VGPAYDITHVNEPDRPSPARLGRPLDTSVAWVKNCRAGRVRHARRAAREYLREKYRP
jgi:hypothetical protein